MFKPRLLWKPSPCCVFYADAHPLLMLWFLLFISRLKRYSALSDVSTVSFPLQSMRIRSWSCKDRPLGRTCSLPVELTDHFGSTLPPCRSYWLWCYVYVRAEDQRRKKLTECAHLLRRSRNKMAQRQDFNFAVLHFMTSWHINTTFILTFNHQPLAST